MVFNHIFHHIPTKHLPAPTYKIYLSSPTPSSSRTSTNLWNAECNAALPVLSALFSFSAPSSQTHSSAARLESGLGSNNPFAKGGVGEGVIEHEEKEEGEGEDALHTTTQEGKPKAEVVYVEEGEWRAGGVGVEALPAVVKRREGEVVAVLCGGECLDGGRLEGILGA